MPIRLDMSCGRRKQSSIRVEDALAAFGLAHIIFLFLYNILSLVTSFLVVFFRCLFFPVVASM